MQDYIINSRPYISAEALPHELSVEPHKNYLFDLSYLSGIHIQGAGALEFLQGQLSCDTREVTSIQMQQGAMCNLKGRVLALVDVIQSDSYGVQLILPSDLIEDTKASLAKTALFSRVALHDAQDYGLLGFYVQNPDDICPPHIMLPNSPYAVSQASNYYCYHLDKHCYIFLVPTAEISLLSQPFKEKSQWRGSLAWHALQLQHQRIDIYPESRGIFLPHRLGLQDRGYINFKKGCYKGQEIIARTHYKAKLKHEMRLFTFNTDEVLSSGQRLVDPDTNQDVGELVDFCPLGNKTFLIAASVLIEAKQDYSIRPIDAES